MGGAEFGPKDFKAWSAILGLNTISNQNRSVPMRDLKAIDRDTGRELDVGNALNVQPSGKYVYQNGEWYILADATFDADEPREGNPHEEDIFGGNTWVEEEARHNWGFVNANQTSLNYEAIGLDGGSDVVKGQILIPIQKKLNDQGVMDQVNGILNVTNKYQGAQVGGDAYGQQQHMGQQYSSMVQGLMDKGFSKEEAMERTNTYFNR